MNGGTGFAPPCLQRPFHFLSDLNFEGAAEPLRNSNTRGSVVTAGKQLWEPICVRYERHSTVRIKKSNNSCLIHDAFLPVFCHFNGTSVESRAGITSSSESQTSKFCPPSFKDPQPLLPPPKKKSAIFVA